MSFTLGPALPMLSQGVKGLNRIEYADSYPELDALCEGVRELAPAAFRALYASQTDLLHSFAFSILRDRAGAEDAVQQAFLELVKAAPTFTGDGRSIRAWLFRSVRFRCLDEIRRKSRRQEDLRATLPDRADEPFIEHGLDPELEAALSRLTNQQRQVLFLRHVAGMSGHETAGVLGMKRGAVFATAARAERRLRQLLATESEVAS